MGLLAAENLFENGYTVTADGNLPYTMVPYSKSSWKIRYC